MRIRADAITRNPPQKKAIFVRTLTQIITSDVCQPPNCRYEPIRACWPRQSDTITSQIGIEASESFRPQSSQQI